MTYFFLCESSETSSIPLTTLIKVFRTAFSSLLEQVLTTCKKLGRTTKTLIYTDWECKLYQSLGNLVDCAVKSRLFSSSGNLNIWLWYSIQILNVYDCSGEDIFVRRKMEPSIPRGDSRVGWNIPSFTE